MKRNKIWAMLAVAVAFLIVSTGVVFAAGLNQGTPPLNDRDEDFQFWGPMHGRRGGWSSDEPLMHEAMVQALADVTGLSVEEIEDRISDGERLFDIALGAGMDQAAFFDLMQDTRETVLAEALESGLISEEQYQWMQNRKQGDRYGRGFGGCHRLEGEGYPQDGRTPRRGSGRRW
jgi:hypothetical protein